MNAATHPVTNSPSIAGVPPAPPEAHQRADGGAGEGRGGARGLRATYCAEDNKLRLRGAMPLSTNVSLRLADAGFVLAQAHGPYVAPKWTPAREDLLKELCGHIETEEAAPASHAARPHRIKALTTELNKHRRARAESAAHLTAWEWPVLSVADALAIAVRDDINVPVTVDGKAQSASLFSLLESGAVPVDEAIALATARHRNFIAWSGRWITHYTYRLAYEASFVVRPGAIQSPGFDIAVGGMVKVQGLWHRVLRVKKEGGKIASVSTNSRLKRNTSVAEISDYLPGEPAEAERAAAAIKLPPVCNYPGTDFVAMTKAQWEASEGKKLRRLGQGARTRRNTISAEVAEAVASAPVGLHRVRFVMLGGALRPVYLTDVARRDPPPAARTAPTQNGEASA